MTAKNQTSRTVLFGLDRTAPVDRLARRFFLRFLSGIRMGRLHLLEGRKRISVGRRTDNFPVEATIFVKNPRFYRQVVMAGIEGAAASFACDHWATDNLTDALRIVLLNRIGAERARDEWHRFFAPIRKLLYLARPSFDDGSRDNDNIPPLIEPGDNLYPLIFNDGESRSCGIFRRPDATLAEATATAYERICRKLRLQSDDHVLEIGGDSGGFAVHAATHYGCRLVVVVDSENRRRLIRRRVEATGAADRIQVAGPEIRHLRGRFDKLVSIESVGNRDGRYQDAFFYACNRLLKADGMIALQMVTRVEWGGPDSDSAAASIQSSGAPPSLTEISRLIERHTRLRLVHLEDITPHYAVTMRRWRKQLYANVDRARDLGVAEPILRRWDYDLCLAEAGYAERYYGCSQMVWAKSLSRQQPILPPLASKFGVILQKETDDAENWLS